MYYTPYLKPILTRFCNSIVIQNNKVRIQRRQSLVESSRIPSDWLRGGRRCLPFKRVMARVWGSHCSLSISSGLRADWALSCPVPGRMTTPPRASGGGSSWPRTAGGRRRLESGPWRFGTLPAGRGHTDTQVGGVDAGFFAFPFISVSRVGLFYCQLLQGRWRDKYFDNNSIFYSCVCRYDLHMSPPLFAVNYLVPNT